MSGQEEEDKKPDTDLSTHINLKVATQQEDSAVFYRIKKSTPLKKLMNSFCKKQGVMYGTYVFTYDGREIGIEQTPEQLEMVDGDEIDAFLHQNGGTTA